MTRRVFFNFPFRLGLNGIGNTGWQQANALVELGHDVVIATPSCERRVPGAQTVETLTIAGMRVPLGRFGVERMLRAHGARAASVFRKLHGDALFDVVHCWPRGSMKLIDAARDAGVPTFYERPNTHVVHGFEVVHRENVRLGLADGPPPATDDRQRREVAEYDASDFLLCPSEAVADSFRDRGYADDRLIRTRYGCDLETFLVDPDQMKERPERPLTMLFAGKADARKGLHFALDAWHRTADARHGTGTFRVAGAIDDEYAAKLGPALSHDGVECIGFTNDVASEMRRADVFVLPSIEEGSALVTYEARASGCVVVASTAAGAPVEHDVDGLLHEPGDVDTLADQIAALSTDGDLLRRLRCRSMERASDLSWLAAGRSLAAGYEDGLRRRMPGIAEPETTPAGEPLPSLAT
ncbi:MAG: glycosyltransferase family 4 protein [Planctomycetota bacterium]